MLTFAPIKDKQWNYGADSTHYHRKGFPCDTEQIASDWHRKRSETALDEGAVGERNERKRGSSETVATMAGYTRDIILPEGDIIRVTLSEEQGIVSGAARQLNKNTMPPQKYRSLLFENMFRRYTRMKRIDDVCLSVVEVSGINETGIFPSHIP
ncbi:MAG: hypothetical protein IJT53_04480 [Prevotella sp.]|nr:hypothetical protein [Prevotella sp.]